VIPFFAALLVVLAIYITRPSPESHMETIRENYFAERTTASATWWYYQRSLEYYDYLFFSVVKHKHETKSIGLFGITYYMKNG